MAIRGSYTIDGRQIDKMSLTIEITMQVEEWRNLMRQMPTDKYEGNNVGFMISSALGDVERAAAKAYSYPEKP